MYKRQVKPRPDILGRKYGRLFPKIREAIENNAEKLAETLNKGESIVLNVEQQQIRVLPEEVEVKTQPREEYTIAGEDEILVAINTRITEDLKMEGLARDIVRRIQNQRKEAGFNIADWIETYYEAGPELSKVFEKFEGYISNETLSKVILRSRPPKNAHVATYKIGGETLKIGLIRVKN